ncbi:MAG: hypothetical protein LBJ20_02250 [Candidatus Methanoplasma sp.]|nr:hypothetical protein [Candidatus Methanoplasma sp.]
MYGKITVATVTLAVLGVTLFISATEMSDGEDGDESPPPPLNDIYSYAIENASMFIHGKVVIISNVKDDENSKELAPNATVRETFDLADGINVVMIDVDWAESLDREYLYSGVDAIVEESHPVILISGDSPWILSDREVPVA